MRRSGALTSALLLAVFWSGQAQGQGTEPTPRLSKSPSKQARPAQPADPAKSERERDIAKASTPMTFTRVRSASPDCGASCPEWIAAEGRIMPNLTSTQLKRMIAGMGDKKLPIFIHSAGGAVEEAYAMGRLIRAKGLTVSVTKTDLVDCAKDDKAKDNNKDNNECRTLQAKGVRLGNPKPPLSVCASSCVFVLAGGVQRHVGPLSLIGVHQYESSVTQVQVLQKYRMVPHPRTGDLVKEVISEERVSQRTIKTNTRDEVYDKSEVYFKEMGVTSAIMTPLRATPHTSMHWLSPSEVNDTKIATDRKAGTQVLGLMPAGGPGFMSPDIAARLKSAIDAGAPRDGIAYIDCGLPANTALLACRGRTGRIEVAAVPSAAALSAPAALARAIQVELKAGNCLGGKIGDTWSDVPKRAVAAFAEATGTRLEADRPTDVMLSTIRSAVAAREKVCAKPIE
jgi:hypothetical protein